MYHVDINNKKMTLLEKPSFSSSGLKERQDLQEWIVSNPNCLGEDLLIIQKEFDGFDNTNERLDLLALDKNGNLVIIENKTDSSGRDVVWQSIKYASYCSRLTEDKTISIYAAYLIKHDLEVVQGKEPKEIAKANIYDFLDRDDENELTINSDEISQRIIMVASNYRPEVTSAVLWLINFGIDIKCIKCQLFTFNGNFFIDMQQIIPFAEAEAFMIDLAEKKKEKNQNVSARKVILKNFWSQLIATVIENYENIYSHRSSTSDNWLGASTGFNGVSIAVVINRDKAALRLEINAKDKVTTLAIFDYIHRMRSDFEKEIDGDIEWLRRPEGVLSIVKITKTGLGYEDEENWFASIEYLIKTSTQLKNVITPILQQYYQNQGK